MAGRTDSDGGGLPQAGDRVTALTRDGGEPVTGVLGLTHDLGADYVHIFVLAGGGAVKVMPSSIEVVTRVVDPPSGTYSSHELISDLDEALALSSAADLANGGWDATQARLDGIVQPLLDAGWVVVDSGGERSLEYGDAVYVDLERNGVPVELELFEHGQINAFPNDPRNEDEDDERDEVTEPFFSIMRATPEQIDHELRTRGWI